MAILFLCLVVSVIGAPFWVALIRHHPSRWAIFFTLIFFGWTVIGWAVALIWSFGSVPAAGRTA